MCVTCEGLCRWAFSSTTSSIDVLNNDMFCGTTVAPTPALAPSARPSLTSDPRCRAGRAHHLSHPRLQRRRHQRPQQHLRRSATPLAPPPPVLFAAAACSRARSSQRKKSCCCPAVALTSSRCARPPCGPAARLFTLGRVTSVAGGEPARGGAWPRHDRPGGSGLAVLVDGRMRAARPRLVLPPCRLSNHRDRCRACLRSASPPFVLPHFNALLPVHLKTRK